MTENNTKLDSRLENFFFSWQPLASEPEALQAHFLRERTRDILRAFSKLGSTGHQERQRAYECICNPFDDIKQAEKLADSQWSCGQIGLALLRFLGLDEPLLDEKNLHLVGGPLAQLVRIGQKHNAWLDGKNKGLLPPSSEMIIIIGSGGNDSHALCTVDVRQRTAGGWFVQSVDGGQAEFDNSTKENGRCVKERLRVLTPEKIWLDADGQASPEHPKGGGRPTYGAIDLFKFNIALYRRNMTLPLLYLFFCQFVKLCRKPQHQIASASLFT